MIIGAAILAAGASRRLGRPKQLVPCHGVPLVRAIAAEAIGSRADRVAVVVGAHAREVAAAVAGLPLAIEANWLWPEGIASSLRTAVSWAIRTRCDGLCVLACDQPRLTTAHVDRLLSAFRTLGGHAPIASAYGCSLGVPAVFPAASFPSLLGLAGDRGAVSLLAASGVGAVDWPDGVLDVDVPDDLAHVG
jgi:molybdenum cofactor cytidylyltransferase|nr:nucleotidyltransferase family protein [Kofleriaceae bacterium]